MDAGFTNRGRTPPWDEVGEVGVFVVQKGGGTVGAVVIACPLDEVRNLRRRKLWQMCNNGNVILDFVPQMQLYSQNVSKLIDPNDSIAIVTFVLNCRLSKPLTSAPVITAVGHSLISFKNIRKVSNFKKGCRKTPEKQAFCGILD